METSKEKGLIREKVLSADDRDAVLKLTNHMAARSRSYLLASGVLALGTSLLAVFGFLSQDASILQAGVVSSIYSYGNLIKEFCSDITEQNDINQIKSIIALDKSDQHESR